MADVDDGFFDRADEHIHLSNRQMSKVDVGKVSASMMYSVARFNAHVNALNWASGKEMNKNKQEALDYFVGQFKKMLDENLNDYISNFEKYMGADKEDSNV